MGWHKSQNRQEERHSHADKQTWNRLHPQTHRAGRRSQANKGRLHNRHRSRFYQPSHQRGGVHTLPMLLSGKRRCATQDWAKQYALQRQYPITAEAFDVMELYGLDVTKQPYLARKKLLFELLETAPPEIQYTPYTFELERAWEDVVRRGAEGLILKDINSSYEYDRSYKWIKLKNWKKQIVDVVGYTPGKNARAAFFGSLVLARDGKFVGCAGSGFNDWELRQLKDMFSDAPKTPKPFDIGDDYTALDINLKVEVKYYKHTEANNVMRFPVFSRVIS